MHDKNVVSWTGMIYGYVKGGCYDDGLMMLLGMRQAGLRANQFGNGSALRACTGLRCFEVGNQIQGCIAEVRDLVLWNAMIGDYAVQGFANDSLHMFHSMMKKVNVYNCG
ncbi:hypothetical protein TB1_004311 [Malus domestica]